MVLSLEDHPVTPQSRRASKNAGQLEVSYFLDGREARFEVAVGHETAIVGSDAGADILPSPLANDLLVVLGEIMNQRARRSSDFESFEFRTVRFPIRALLNHVGRDDSPSQYEALIDAGRKLAKLRISARGGAWRSKKGRIAPEVVFGLIDRFEVLTREKSPQGAQLEFIISRDWAQRLMDEYRLLDSDLYWRIGNDMARRLYRLIDSAYHYAKKRRALTEPVVRLPVHYLRDRIPIAESKSAKLVRSLHNVHAHLVDAEYLDSMPTFEDATPDDYELFPSNPGHSARRMVAIYRLRQPALEVRKQETAQLPGPTRPSPSLSLADRMAVLEEHLSDFREHVPLCKIAAEAPIDDDTFFRLASTARQECGQLPPVAFFVMTVRRTLRERGVDADPRLYNKERQQELLLGKRG